MKQLSKDKIQRMRNLVSGEYGAKTKSSSGYVKYNKKRNEGDVWEEGGKIWTIKNGIKQNKTKLGEARKSLKIPLSCPKCNTSMKNSAHKKMYRLYGHCLHCQTKFEHDLYAKGKYKEWFEKEVRNNFESWTTKQEKRFNEWFNTIDSNHYITESGEVESWSKLTENTKKDIKRRFKEWIDSEKELTEKLLNGEKL
jgi:hypothetical protein